jgi:hypothetical protein
MEYYLLSYSQLAVSTDTKTDHDFDVEFRIQPLSNYPKQDNSIPSSAG